MSTSRSVDRFLVETTQRVKAMGQSAPEPPETTSTFEAPDISIETLAEAVRFVLHHCIVERGFEPQARALRRKLAPREVRTGVDNFSMPL